MNIIHAVSNELGRSIGGQAGDQTGQEIRKAAWYNRPWETYMECTDEYLADKAATIAEKIEKGNFGYSRESRWSGYKAIKKVGLDHLAEAKAGDFDCSSLVLSCYILAGLDIKATGYTQTLEKILLKTGKFVSYKDEEHVASCKLAKRGSIYLMPGKHVIICVPAAKKTEKKEENLKDYVEVIYKNGSVRIRSNPDKAARTIAIAREGHKYECLGEENGWYKIRYDGDMVAYITANFKYTKRHAIEAV